MDAIFTFARTLIKYDRFKCIIERDFTKKDFVVITSGFILLCFMRIRLIQNDYSMSVYALNFLKQLIKYAIGCIGVWLVYLIAKIAEQSKLKSLLKLLGDYSCDIYLMHNPYIVAIVTILCDKFLKLPGAVSLLLATILGVCVPILIGKWVISKSKVLSVVMIDKW